VGVFALKDAWGVKRLATQKLENAMTIRAGEILYERDGVPAAEGKPEIYDILLRNGQVIDPANHRTGRYDVAVIGGKIAHVGHDLPASHARIAIDASRYYVTPGLIDIRTHLGEVAGGRSIQPDHNCLPYGVTTAVLAGGVKEIPSARTRLFAFVEPDHTPDTIWTDIDADSVLLQHNNMMTRLSKSVNQGMTVEQVVERTTVNAARAIRRPDLGTLSEGAVADIALVELERGKFPRLQGDRRLRCVLTVRNGAIVWDTDGLGAPDQVKAGPYSNFK
jgi:predicted amidohydrolase